MFVGGHLGVSGIRPERANQPSPGQRPGVADAKRKSPALCEPSPTLLGQGGGRFAERGTADAAIRPRVPLRPEGFALPWAGLICPSGAPRAFPFIRENIRPNRPRGFAPGYRPPALQAAPSTLIRAVGPRDDSPGRNPGRIRPPSTLLFGGLVVCALRHPLAHMGVSHMD